MSKANLVGGLVVGVMLITRVRSLEAQVCHVYPPNLIQDCVNNPQCQTCLLHAGIFRQTVTPKSGTSETQPFVIKADPADIDRVTVSGTELISGPWEPYGTFYRKQINDPGIPVTQVFVNGQMMTEARWPNAGPDPLEPAFARTTGGTCDAGGGSITDTALPTCPGTCWTNGGVVHILGGQAWAMYTAPVFTQNGSTLVLTLSNTVKLGCPAIGPKGNNKYYLTGKLHALDARREWIHEGNYLYLWAPGGEDPATDTIEVDRGDRVAFHLEDRSYVEIRDLNIFAARVVMNGGSAHNTLDGITVTYPVHMMTQPEPYEICCNGNQGIVLEGRGNALKNSRIGYSSGAAVTLAGDSNELNNSLIRHSDYAGNFASPIQFTRTIYPSHYGGHLVEHNTVIGSGRDRIGIHVDDVNATNRIQYNDVSNMAMMAQDAGGLYTYGKPAAGVTTAVVAYNHFHDLQAKTNGGVGGYTGAGIYLDVGSDGFQIHHNVSWNNVGDGARLNGATNIAGQYMDPDSSFNRLYFNTLGHGQLRSVGSCCAWRFDGSRLESNIFTGVSELTSQGFLDELFDFTRSGGTGDMVISTASPGDFEEDTHRATRANTSSQWVQWAQDTGPNPTSPFTAFTATVYSRQSGLLSDVMVIATSDGTGFIPIPDSYIGPPVPVSSSWYRYNVNATSVPSGTKYVRMTWNVGGQPDSPQVGRFAGTIAAGAATTAYNLVQPPPPTPPIDPKFVDAATGNFRLLSSSPAIDQGQIPAGEPEVVPCAVNNPDQGAYEWSPYGPACEFAPGCALPGCGLDVIDYMRDWSRTASRSASMFIDGQFPYQFDGDDARAAAYADGQQWLMWKVLDLESATVVAYFWPGQLTHPTIGIAWSSAKAPDPAGETGWVTVPTLPRVEGTNWLRYTYAVTGLNGTGARFLRLKWQSVVDSPWSPEIAQVRMTRVTTNPGGLIIDPLDSTNYHYDPALSSSNLYFEMTPIGGDTSKLIRLDPTPQEPQGDHVVWKDLGMKAFSAATYFYTPYGDEDLRVFVSTDANVWSPVKPAVNCVASGSTDWDRCDYLIDNLTNVNYVKMEWGASVQTWAPQIGGVRLTH